MSADDAQLVTTTPKLFKDVCPDALLDEHDSAAIFGLDAHAETVKRLTMSTKDTRHGAREGRRDEGGGREKYRSKGEGRGKIGRHLLAIEAEIEYVAHDLHVALGLTLVSHVTCVDEKRGRDSHRTCMKPPMTPKAATKAPSRVAMPGMIVW